MTQHLLKMIQGMTFVVKLTYEQIITYLEFRGRLPSGEKNEI